MARKNLKRYVLRYTVIAGLPSGAVFVAIAVFSGVPVPLAGLGITLVALLIVCGIVGTTDTGIETVSAGAVGGALGNANPMDFQPDELSLPDRLAIVCWFAGVGIVGFVSLLTYY